LDSTHQEVDSRRTAQGVGGVGMAEKTIATGLCPGGRLRMERLLRLLETKRVDPIQMTTHTLSFSNMDQAFEIMDKKLDGVLKPLIVFE
jgi:isopropanol dehydrogenase (NADP+)